MPLQATPQALGLILQARPRHFYGSGERLRAAAGAWQVCCGPSLVLSQPHPLAFLKGLVSQGPGKLPQCFLPDRGQPVGVALWGLPFCMNGGSLEKARHKEAYGELERRVVPLTIQQVP